MKHKLASILIPFLFAHIMYSQTEELVIKKTNSVITLDGIINKEEWKDATQFSYTELLPNWKNIDSLTDMYVTFNEDNLYIAINGKEPLPEKIIRRSLIRDKWYGDDYMAFHIDPNVSKKNGFIFSVLPEGSRIDSAVSNDAIPLGRSTFNGSYDMIWKAETKTTESGWCVEFEIPISNLRFIKDEKGQVKGAISSIRSQNYLNRQVTYPELPQNIPNAIETPSLKRPVIFEGLEPKKQLQITPYVLGSLDKGFRIDDESNTYKKIENNNLDAGLDIRYGISPSLTLDATINTDFAQVEIDDQVINLNNRINIFLPEKRKFFQEQAGLFDFNAGFFSQLFYSRKIGVNNGRLTPIIGGARLTGQIGNTDIGLLSIQTEGINLGNDLTVPSENFSVLRLRNKIFNDKSFIGFMATNRIRKDSYNTAFGIDGVFSMPDDLYLISSISSTIDKADDNFNLIDNTRVSLFLDKRKQDNWFYRAIYEFSGDNYNPDMGFILRERYNNFYGSLSHGKYNQDREKNTFQYSRWTFLNSDIYLTTDFSEVITWYNRTFWLGNLFNGDSFSAFAQIQYESLDSPFVFNDILSVPKGNYTYTYFGASYSPGNQRKIQFPISTEYGQFFDGTNFRFDLGPTINFGKHFNIESSWRVNHIKFKDRDLEDWIHIAQAKFNWAYDTHLSGSLISQYNSNSNQVLTSARIRYNFRDGHDLYLVYNHDYNLERDSFSPQLPRYNNQVFTVKYLYTIFK